MEYLEQAVPEKLRSLAACTWSLHTQQGAPDFSVRPDGCVDVILWPDGKLRVTGAMTRPQTAHLPTASSFAGIRFRPGAAASVLPVPMDELTDQTVLFEEITASHDARRLQDQLAAEPSIKSQRRVLAGHFEQLAIPLNPVQHAIAWMAVLPANIDVVRVADQAGLSSRQFRRRCLEESGLTPKLLTRILRFQRALGRAARGTHQSWADIAAHCGYFDQAHLIRDFQEFAGASPVSVLSKARALVAG